MVAKLGYCVVDRRWLTSVFMLHAITSLWNFFVVSGMEFASLLGARPYPMRDGLRILKDECGSSPTYASLDLELVSCTLR